ncbi:MAG: protein BatD [Lewinellaceae bacterium]|nr:protein BatD [Lewinellaceae bacterium]
MTGRTLYTSPALEYALKKGRWIFILFGVTSTLWGQSPTFTTSLDVKEVIVGNPFEVTFTLTDAEGRTFSPPAFREFTTKGSVSESRGMTLNKGKKSSRQSWSYLLEAKKAGTFNIGSATVTVDGKTLKTEPYKLVVLAAPSAAGGKVVPPGKDDEVFIIGMINTDHAFPGQQLTWQLKLFTRVAIEGADLISLPAFDDFYSREKRRFDTRIQYQMVQGKKYAVKILHEEALFPQKTGRLTIGSAKVRVGLDQPGAQGFLYGPKLATLSSQPTAIDVSSLPEPVPDNFIGGIGHYEWEVHADTSSLSTDDALTLVISLKGNGDSRRVSPPKIPVPATCEIFDPRIISEEEYESETEIVHEKQFEYVILPREPGHQELLASLTYFDLDSNRYCTLHAEAIKFEVSAGENYKPADNVEKKLPVTNTAKDEDGLGSRMLKFLSEPVFVGTVISSMVTVALVWFFVSKRKKTVKEPATVADIKQMPSAIQQFYKVEKLATSANSPDPPHFYGELLKALQSYISLKLHISQAELDHSLVKEKLERLDVPSIRIQAFLSIWESCEASVYSGQSAGVSIRSDWDAAEKVVLALEKDIPGSSLN